MNCKQGDLALIIKGPNAGVVVTCESLATYAEWPTFISGDVWRIDKKVRWHKGPNDEDGILAAYAPDRVLLPISPGDEQRLEFLGEILDETTVG